MQTVVILICTFNRPRYLDELLSALTHDVSSASCKTLSIVVIDIRTQDVHSLVKVFRSALPVEYVRLPGSGLVGAQNCSLRTDGRHDPGNLVFTDDEIPESGWLNGLLSTVNTSGADFAVGPVDPKFSQTPPSRASELFTKSGVAFCTSNFIIRTSVVPQDEWQWFQPRLSATGERMTNFCVG